MKLYYKESPRTLVLVSETHSLLFKTVSSSTGKPRCLVELVKSSDIEERQHLRKLYNNEIYGFLGLIEVNELIFLVTITGRSEVAVPLENESVNRILNVEFFCLNSSKYDELIVSSVYIAASDEGSAEDVEPSIIDHPCNDLKKLLGDGSFCYSTNFDLTNNLQTRGVTDNSLSIDTFQDEYMWNSFMMNEMIQYRNKASDAIKQDLDSNGFLTTVIRGFAKTQRLQIAGLDASLSIISRQSWKRAGTRYNARGIDDDGNVANFVETELILNVVGKIVCSFVEIRGSIPVFWEQDTQLSLSTPKVQITRSKEATQPVFLKHFSTLLDKYHTVHVVNLLSRKSTEIELSKRFRDHIELSQNTKTPVTTENTMLTEFDFHQQTKGGNYASARRILNYVSDSVEQFEYFSYSYMEKKVMTTQSGVFRTNCLDCLDRTNLTQQVLGSSVLELILHDYNLLDSLKNQELLQCHNLLWADNGDQISQIYTGTNALKSSFSRSGKMTLGLFLSDATKSVTRMYQNNFVDKNKQVTIDTLLGRIPGQAPVILYDPVNENVEVQMKKQEASYTHESIRSIFAGTFNLNGLGLNNKNDYESLAEWLMPDNNYFYSEQPDVYVLGFQEVVELNAANILNADYGRSSVWQKAVGNMLNGLSQDNSYTLIRAEQMSSLLILFFAKSSLADKITNVEGYTKKTGLGGITGNKGAIAIRFNIGATSFCVVNSHLASGQTAVIERNNDYHSILNGIYFSRGGKVFNHQNVIWLGDLNYRISLANEDVRKEIARDNLSLLLTADQLLNEIHTKTAFASFEEKEITFKPTYKFDNYSNNYDSLEKQRTPSWTDRVVYKGPLSPLQYDAVPSILFSDHKPVYCLFEANVKFVNDTAKQNLYNQLYAKYKANSNHQTVSLLDIINGKTSENTSQRKPPSANRTGTLLDFTTSSSQSFMNNSSSDHLPSIDLLSLDPNSSRRATTLDTAPPPPLPRRAATLASSATTPTKASHAPPVPPTRKSALQKSPTTSSSSPALTPSGSGSTPPPGFSMAVLQPKNKPTVASPPTPAKKNSQTLASMAQQLELRKAQSISNNNSSTSLASASPKPKGAPPTGSLQSTPSGTPSLPPGFFSTSVLLPAKKNGSSTTLSRTSSTNQLPIAKENSTPVAAPVKKKAPPPLVPKKPKNLTHKSGENTPTTPNSKIKQEKTVDDWKPLVPK